MSQQKGLFSQPCYAAVPKSISKADKSGSLEAVGYTSAWWTLSEKPGAESWPCSALHCFPKQGWAVGMGMGCCPLVQMPVHGASYLGTTEGVRIRTDPRNALFLVSFCCSPPLWVTQWGHLLPAPLHRAQPSLDCIFVDNHLADCDPHWSQHPASNKCLAPLLFDYCLDA